MTVPNLLHEGQIMRTYKASADVSGSYNASRAAIIRVTFSPEETARILTSSEPGEEFIRLYRLHMRGSVD
jgi:hypothetical protein